MMMEYSTGMDSASSEMESVDTFVRAVAANVRATRLDAGVPNPGGETPEKKIWAAQNPQVTYALWGAFKVAKASP